MGMYSTTTANAYADKIKAVYEYLDEIRKVAGRLTPVEDLTSFQAQIEALYAQLDLLVEASNIIVTATPTGEAILTGSVASIKTLLEIGVYPDDWVTQAELDAALALLRTQLEAQIASANGSISAINLTVEQLDQYRVIQQASIEGLQIDYTNVAAGLQTNQTNTESALSRLTVQEQFATLVDQQLESINQGLTSTTTGLQAANQTLAGHTASITSAHNAISLHTASIDQLNSDLTLANSGITANASALSLMETTITGIGEDITAQSSLTTALKSVIGGSGNLLSNADFAAGANGWDIVVAEEDWATTLLTTDTFNMPVEVHCLEVLGQPTPLGQIVVQSPAMLLEEDQHYVVSGYPCVDNGTVQLSYKVFDNAGLVLDQGICPATFNVTTNINFNAYTRTWIKFLAPSGAATLRLYLTVTGDGDFITQGALFRPMVEQGWAEQAGPSAWTPNITGIPEVLAEAVQTLTTEVASTQSGVEANAQAITDLTAEVGDKAEASALATLDTYVRVDVDGRIDVAASDITALETEVAGKATTSALNSLTTRVETEEGKSTAASSDITSLKASLTGSGNLIPNSDFLDVTGSGTSEIPVGTTIGSSVSGEYAVDGISSFFHIPNVPVFIIRNLGADLLATGAYLQLNIGRITQPYPIPVIAGKEYLFSVYVAAHRCHGGFYVRFYDAAGAVLPAGNANTSFAATAPGGVRLDLYDRLYVKKTAPALAVSVEIWVRGLGDTSAYSGTVSYLAITRPMVEEVSATQTTPSPWSASSAGRAGAVALSDLTARVVETEGDITTIASDVVALTSTVEGKASSSALSTLDAQVQHSTTGLATRASATSVTALKAAINGGGNLLYNSSFARGGAGFQLTSAGSGWSAVAFNGPSAAWIVPGTNNGYRNAPGTVAVDVYRDTMFPRVPVLAGKRYCVSAYLAAHRAKFTLYCFWRDKDGVAISAPNAGQKTILGATGVGAGGEDINNWIYDSFFATAPSNAAYADVFVRSYGAGLSNSYVWFMRPMIEEVSAEQTAPSPWNEGGVQGTLEAVESLSIDSATMLAKYTLTLDVNGYVTGITSVNSGTYSEFAVTADKFKVVKPGGGAGLTWENGVMWNRGSTYSVILGQNFGTASDFLMWAGPNPASAAAANKSTAVMYLTNTGILYVKGTLIAGSIQNGGYSTNLATSVTFSTGTFGTNGGPIYVNASYSYSQMQKCSTLAGNYTAGSGNTQATLQLWQKIGTGAFQLVGSLTATGTQTINNTAPDASSTVNWDITGAITFTDNVGGTLDRTYELRMTTRTLKAVSLSSGTSVKEYESQATGVTTQEG